MEDDVGVTDAEGGVGEDRERDVVVGVALHDGEGLEEDDLDVDDENHALPLGHAGLDEPTLIQSQLSTIKLTSVIRHTCFDRNESDSNRQLKPLLTENVASRSDAGPENLDEPSTSQPEMVTNDPLDTSYGLQYNSTSESSYAISINVLQSSDLKRCSSALASARARGGEARPEHLVQSPSDALQRGTAWALARAQASGASCKRPG
ncbi:hypothetical protein BHM03_00018774 [Ensete ventricosum]|nr:hypothetical protein BHM03_00018774 [Ensete ventricosum]